MTGNYYTDDKEKEVVGYELMTMSKAIRSP